MALNTQYIKNTVRKTQYVKNTVRKTQCVKNTVRKTQCVKNTVRKTQCVKNTVRKISQHINPDTTMQGPHCGTTKPGFTHPRSHDKCSMKVIMQKF